MITRLQPVRPKATPKLGLPAWSLAVLLATGCAVSGPGVVEDDASRPDGPSVGDSATERDADLHPDTPRSRDEICMACTARRCSESARSCLADPACVALEACLTSCFDRPCVDACVAASTVAYARTYDVDACVSACALACTDITPRPELCQPPNVFAPCDREVAGFDCCAAEESCVEPPANTMRGAQCCRDGYCCASGDQECSDAHPCCEGACIDGRCELPTCAEHDCTLLPCCGGMVCDEPSGNLCCYPDGAILPPGASGSACCSASVERVSDTESRCVPRPIAPGGEP